MTPAGTDFVNTNHHEVYIVDPERDDDRTSEASGLLRISAESEFSVSGKRLVEETEKVPGVFRSSSKEAKEFTKKNGVFAQRDIMRSTPGPVAAGPVPEEERTAERSGLHITGKDSGMPVASDVEPGDVKDGSGEDKFKGVAAVEQGEVTRGDVPQAVKEEPSVETASEQPVAELPVKTLRKLAKERDVQIEGGISKAKRDDLVAALEAPAAEGGGGGVAVQTEEASKTEPSEAVGPKTERQPATKRASGGKPRSRSKSKSSKKSTRKTSRKKKS